MITLPEESTASVGGTYGQPAVERAELVSLVRAALTQRTLAGPTPEFRARSLRDFRGALTDATGRRNRAS